MVELTETQQAVCKWLMSMEYFNLASKARERWGNGEPFRLLEKLNYPAPILQQVGAANWEAENRTLPDQT